MEVDGFDPPMSPGPNFPPNESQKGIGTEYEIN